MRTHTRCPAMGQARTRTGLLAGWRPGLAGSMLASLAWLLPSSGGAQTTVALAQAPLLALKSAPGLVMLTMNRDHRLFYAAYNETSDIDSNCCSDYCFNGKCKLLD